MPKLVDGPNLDDVPNADEDVPKPVDGPNLADGSNADEDAPKPENGAARNAPVILLSIGFCLLSRS